MQVFETPRQKKLRRKFEGEIAGLAGGAGEAQELSTKELAKKFGVAHLLKGKDVPKKMRLVQLYSSLHSHGVAGKTYSLAVGLRRTPKDVTAGISMRHWQYFDAPERGLKHLLSKMLPPETVPNRRDATCFAKLHLVVPLFGQPSLIVHPIQKVEIGSGVWDEVEDELKKRAETASKAEKRKIKWKLRHIANAKKFVREYYTPDVDVFDHRDRQLAMALAVLEIAERMGVRRIILPSKRQIGKWNRIFKVNLAAKKRLAKKTGEDVKFPDEPSVPKQYDEIRKLMEAAVGRGFKIIQRRW